MLFLCFIFKYNSKLFSLASDRRSLVFYASERQGAVISAAQQAPLERELEEQTSHDAIKQQLDWIIPQTILTLPVVCSFFIFPHKNG